MDGLRKAARISQVIMGLVFLVSGLVKIWEPVLFYWETIPYTQLLMIENWQLVARLALLLAPFECGLGLALLANWRPRLTFPVSVVLIIYFIGLMVAAWKMGATENCGCFGSLVDRSPGEAAVEDVVMLALLLFGWWGVRALPSWNFAGRLVLMGTLVTLAVGAGRFFPEVARLEKSDLQPGVKLTGLNPIGLEVDIMKGEYLVELMSPRCGHCIESVPKLNSWVEMGDLPPLVALNNFPQDAPALADFKKRYQPRFDIGSISRTDFFRLTWKHGYPRLALVRGGVVQKVWERDDFPDYEELKELAASP
jgi:hypothetical protein